MAMALMKPRKKTSLWLRSPEIDDEHAPSRLEDPLYLARIVAAQRARKISAKSPMTRSSSRRFWSART
jgi:hypothetical protein